MIKNEKGGKISNIQIVTAKPYEKIPEDNSCSKQVSMTFSGQLFLVYLHKAHITNA